MILRYPCDRVRKLGLLLVLLTPLSMVSCTPAGPGGPAARFSAPSVGEIPSTGLEPALGASASGEAPALASEPGDVVIRGAMAGTAPFDLTAAAGDDLAVEGAVSAGQPRSGLTIATGDRDAVLKAYEAWYEAPAAVAPGWTGSVEVCNAGVMAPDYLEATLRRINFFRAMTGQVGDITLDSALNEQAQEAALMMAANGTLSHTPPPEWRCYTTAGARSAGASNLALGAGGPDAISLYMDDSGPNPGPDHSAGHRRWILYPPTAVMGVGDTGQTNALTVITQLRREPSGGEWIAWPPTGYVPYTLAWPMWSLSMAGADFSISEVTMKRDGRSIPVRVLNRDGYGFGDPAILWHPTGEPYWPEAAGLAQDLTYEVAISGVKSFGADGSFRSLDLRYWTTLIDPRSGQPAATATVHADPLSTATALAVPKPSSTTQPVPTASAVPQATVDPGASATLAPSPAPPTGDPAYPGPPPSATPQRDQVATPGADADASPIRCPKLHAPADAIQEALDNPASVQG